jgi:hypothetical protein
MGGDYRRERRPVKQPQCAKLELGANMRWDWRQPPVSNRCLKDWPPDLVAMTIETSLFASPIDQQHENRRGDRPVVQRPVKDDHEFPEQFPEDSAEKIHVSNLHQERQFELAGQCLDHIQDENRIARREIGGALERRNWFTLVYPIASKVHGAAENFLASPARPAGKF